MKKILATLLLSCAMAFSATGYLGVTPLRVGPVSIYGTLTTSGNKIVGKDGQQVMLRGVSLFWSDATGSPYYSSEGISWAAENLGIDVFRFAMGIKCYNSDGSDCNLSDGSQIADATSYYASPSAKESQLDKMVKVAIQNDIYIIVDWHSHRAESEQSLATDFFGRMAQKYAGIPNIIWEVYNEPVNTSASTIASYANTVISQIRNNGSTNLALVGTPNWSQMGNGSCGGVSQTNVAYVFHFYAGSHSLSSFQGNIESCLNGGYPVFISEWGTTDANGNGSVNTSESSNWTTYMDSKRIPNCNWSFRHATVGSETEASAMFDGSTTLSSKEAFSKASYTTSGTFVKNYLVGKKGSWADSLVAGKNSGSCAFASQSISELETSLAGKASASCTYTSSDESVATIENGTIYVKSAGYTVMTGSDGSESVVTIVSVPAQTITQSSLTCRLNGSGCTGYTGNSTMEQKMNDMETAQGAAVTYESSDPSVISVEKLTCTTSECYSYKGQQVWIATFKSLGEANIHITAPAVTGYRALDTTITFYYKKNAQALDTKYFKNQKVALGSTTRVFTLVAHDNAPVTYTIAPEGYGTQDSIYFVAGNTDATVKISASAPETDTYEAFAGSITITIGEGNASMIDGIAQQTVQNISLDGFMQGNNLVVNAKRSGLVKVSVFDMAGKNVKDIVSYMSMGEHLINLGDVDKGRYIVNIKQSSSSKNIPWSNK